MVMRYRGRPKTRLSDNIKDIFMLPMVAAERMAQSRDKGEEAGAEAMAVHTHEKSVR